MKPFSDIDRNWLQSFIERALEEDVHEGDHSSNGSIPLEKQAQARLLFKEDGIVAGIDLALLILEHTDARLQAEVLVHDGAPVSKGQEGMLIRGHARSILKAERLLLNCMQRLSGIATATQRLVKLLEGTNTRLLDTRKTTPNMRVLEKWAVTAGGGINHRMGLYDMVMLKDNHIDAAGSITAAVQHTREYLRANNLNLRIEVETRNLEEVREALAVGGVDVIMLDNFPPALVKEALQVIGGKAQTEASGGITEQNIAEYAATGVDFISVGAITHSVKALDISLKIKLD